MVHAGLLDCLAGLHEWPHGFDKDQEWLSQATQVFCDITAQHVRDAQSQGTPIREHLHKPLPVPG